MTETEQQIVAMLDRKMQMELDPNRYPQMTGGGSYHWLCDAVKLLLQIELERAKTCL
jgi:hypothetical protein